jgi:sigma-B regulation protein RsbU (phosphoserine phosphatase)
MAARGWIRLVAVLFAICAITELRYTIDSVRADLRVAETARLPFAIKAPGATLRELKPEAAAAGLAAHDSSLLIDGQPINGIGPLARIVNGKHPGESIRVQAQRNGAAIDTRLTLAAETISASQWIVVGVLYYLTPWLCIVIGFGVLFLRPNDLLAWLLLLLMLSFAQTAQGSEFTSVILNWESSMRIPAMFYSSLANGLWGVAMLLFGQYFPNRQSSSRLDRALRWFFVVPIVGVTMISAAVSVVAMDDATRWMGAQSLLDKLGNPLAFLMMASVGSFFANISHKWRDAKNPDDRRRFKLLYTGTTVALTPMFFVFLASVILRSSFKVANWWLYPALLMLFVFPLTLAYVIVVEKAMDVRVVIRQGLYYALARRGLRVLMAVVSVTVLLVALRVITTPGARRPTQLMVLAFTVLIIVRVRQGAEWLRDWIDRRFFREAVDADRVLSELSEQVRTIVEVKPLLATVTSTISSTLHVPRVAALVRENGHYAASYALGFGSNPKVEFSSTSAVASKLQKAREPVRVSFARDSWVSQEMDERKQLETLGTELLLPLAINDRLLGFLSLGPKKSEEPYSPTDVRLLQSVATQTGLALENSRLTEAVASEVAQRERLNRELEIAREVQERLFPQSGPKVDGLDYAGKCRPASSVGGDYYDFVPMCDGRLGIAIGDISGKGVPAALLMASLQASLRGLAISNPPALSTLMANLNRLIYDASPSNKYATFFYGVYDAKSREFQYVNGGHNPPMIFRGLEVLRLEEGGPVVGLFGPAQYSQSSVKLEPGDTVVFFTDGVSEAMNNEDEEFDEPRLMDAVRSGAGMKSAELIDHIMHCCDDFAAGAPQHDDMTLVVVRVE